MSADVEPFRTPYASSPGSSTPPPGIGPTEGTRELWTFFWLAILNTVIIAVAGILAWWFVTHP